MIPIFINDNFKLKIPSKLTKNEKIWLLILVVLIVLFVGSAILTLWNLSWWYAISIFIITNVMNIVMFILCSKN